MTTGTSTGTGEASTPAALTLREIVAEGLIALRQRVGALMAEQRLAAIRPERREINKPYFAVSSQHEMIKIMQQELTRLAYEWDRDQQIQQERYEAEARVNLPVIWEKERLAAQQTNAGSGPVAP